MCLLLSSLLALAPTAMADDTSPSDALHRALSARHPVPCAEIEALTDAPVPALLAVVDGVSAPPWAPMRAATCLVEGHATEVQDRLVTWVTDPAVLGLGIQTLGQLDRMPEPVAVAVAGAAVARDVDGLDARRRVAASTRLSVSALADAPPAVEPAP